MRNLDGELWCELGAELGEGPFWDSRTDRLGLVDIATGRLYTGSSDGSLVLQAELDTQLGAALPSSEPGEFLLACREGFRVLAADGTVRPHLDVLGGRADLRFNDAKADPRGRVLAGTLSLEDRPGEATLYRLTDDPAALPLISRVGLCNGLGWSPSADWFYFADTMADVVYRYSYDLGEATLGAVEVFASVEQPDGLCVDADGCVWVALWGAGEVRRYRPDGQLDTVVNLPVPHATSCAFFGDELIITTARATRPDGTAAGPHAGDVFSISAGVSAPPATLWQPAVAG